MREHSLRTLLPPADIELDPGEHRMETRIAKSYVTFRRPFLLSGLDALQPAGTYAVETEEESLDTLNRLAWRRTRTVIQLFRAGATESHPVDPDELHEALLRDLAQPGSSAGALDNPIAPGSNSDIRTATIRLKACDVFMEKTMASKEIEHTNSVAGAVSDKELATHGITRVPVDYFHYRQFRYTNAKDAIAQAKRDVRPLADGSHG